MSHHAATRDLSSTISGSEKLAAANSGSKAAMDKAGSGAGDPAGYVPAPEKLAAANFRSSSTSQHGPIPAGSVHTAWRRAA